MPDAWEKFWTAYEDSLVRAKKNGATAERRSCIIAVEKATNQKGRPKFYEWVYGKARKAEDIKPSGFIEGFVDGWKKGGAVYGVVRHEPPEYLVNLVRVLEEQTAVLRAIPSDTP